eukprot:COSAG01_NODE_924_length_12710_cov_10.895567_14_plen_61_part_00
MALYIDIDRSCIPSVVLPAAADRSSKPAEARPTRACGLTRVWSGQLAAALRLNREKATRD